MKRNVQESKKEVLEMYAVKINKRVVTAVIYTLELRCVIFVVIYESVSVLDLKKVLFKTAVNGKHHRN